MKAFSLITTTETSLPVFESQLATAEVSNALAAYMVRIIQEQVIECVQRHICGTLSSTLGNWTLSSLRGFSH
jgi:hypothetical protein